MLTLLKGIAFHGLARHYDVPAEVQERVEKLAREREPQKIVHYLQDQYASTSYSAGDAGKIKRLLSGIATLVKNVNGPEDAGTLVANYENLTQKQFPRPAWTSMEMQSVDLNE